MAPAYDVSFVKMTSGISFVTPCDLRFNMHPCLPLAAAEQSDSLRFGQIQPEIIGEANVCSTSQIR